MPAMLVGNSLGGSMKRLGGVLFGLVVAFSLGCQGGGGAQCSKWEVVLLGADDLEKGTSKLEPPSPDSMCGKANAGAERFGMGAVCNVPRAVPDGWEPVGAVGAMLLARRCVK